MAKKKAFAQLQPELQRCYDLCTGYVDKWSKIMGIDRWDITVDYNSLKFDEDARTNAYCQSSWQYKSAYLEVFLPTLKGNSAWEIESLIIHELCHILVCEMRGLPDEDGKVNPHEERVVTEMTQAFLRAHYPKRYKT